MSNTLKALFVAMIFAIVFAILAGINRERTATKYYNAVEKLLDKLDEEKQLHLEDSVQNFEEFNDYLIAKDRFDKVFN